MIEVIVVLPDMRKGRVQIDTSFSISEIKNSIINNLKLGKPTNFCLAIAPQDEDRELNRIELQDGDMVLIIAMHNFKGAPVKFLEELEANN